MLPCGVARVRSWARVLAGPKRGHPGGVGNAPRPELPSPRTDVKEDALQVQPLRLLVVTAGLSPCPLLESWNDSPRPGRRSQRPLVLFPVRAGAWVAGLAGISVSVLSSSFPPSERNTVFSMRTSGSHVPPTGGGLLCKPPHPPPTPRNSEGSVFHDSKVKSPFGFERVAHCVRHQEVTWEPEFGAG